MILIIDNYDSFVYNLARYVENVGYKTLVLRNDQVNITDIENLNPSYIIISPGPGAPDDAGISLDIVKHFYTRLPILGVCLGHQVIGQAFGATVGHAKQPLHGRSSIIMHNGQDIFHGIENPLTVGRYHSLIVENLADDSELLITAKSTENEIMALKHRDYPVFGVQFHPESVLTKCGMEIIYNFTQSYAL